VALGLHLRHVRRYTEIGRLLVKYGRSDVARTIGFDDLGTDIVGNGPAPPEAEHLAEDLERLGPTFVKLGQLLSTRTDLIPTNWAGALARLQDGVAPMPMHEVTRVFEDALGTSISSAFEWFDEAPLASASLGQVHRARLANGHEVVVKVQRPGTRERVTEDMEAIGELASVLDEHTDIGRRMGFAELVQQFAHTLADELDYRREADNLVRIAEVVAPFDRLVVPRPVPALTTDRVLTMDAIEGRKVTTIGPVGLTDVDGDLLAGQLFGAYLEQVLVAGFFHADPHPGNLLLTPDGRIALLDLGMVAHVPHRFRDALLELLLGVADGRGDDVAAVALRMGQPLSDLDEPAFVRGASQLVARTAGMQLGRIDAGSLVLEICRLAANCGLRLPPELSLLGKALLNLDQVTRALAPTFDPTEALEDRLSQVLRTRIAPSRERLLTTAIETRDLIAETPGRVNRLMETLGRGEFSLNVDAFDEKELMRGLQQVANRITMGLLLAALVVGGAMLTRVDTTWELLGYPGLAILCFLIAAGGASWLLLTIALDGRRRRR
jgi:ubiquinone biosynthesis protein